MLSLREVLQLSDDSLLASLRTFLYNHGYHVQCAGNGFVYGAPRKDARPVLLVAHCDTVFHETLKDIYYNKRLNVLWSPQGLGADDRAGVWAIVEIIRTGQRPFVLFTNGEESGGWGAKMAARSLPAPPVNYIIELDRRGTRDAVFYECANEEFIAHITGRGYWSKAQGTFTDISILCPEWKLCGVNLSIGYEHEHSRREILNIATLLRNISQVKDLIQENTPSFAWKGCNQARLCEINHNENSGHEKYYCALCDTCFETYPDDGIVCPNCGNDDLRTILDSAGEEVR